MTSRTFAIGDIHGCRIALTTLCDSLRLQSDDLLIVLGDVVDRGPDSRGAIEYLLELQESSVHCFNWCQVDGDLNSRGLALVV
jgi:serine/threonine protein phosphatase 1